MSTLDRHDPPAPVSCPTPIVVGPTAGGKSDLAVRVAHGLIARGRPAEILTADAFQIYRGMDIGTAKPTTDERRGIPHHLLDLIDPGPSETPFTVYDWLARARDTIHAVRARGAVPIVVGGTHLYVKALLEGLFEGPGSDPALRERLRATDPVVLRDELRRVDPAAAVRIHPNDLRRTVRAIEVFRLTGTPISAQQTQWDTGDSGPADDSAAAGAVGPNVLIGLRWSSEAINPRINARVRDMMKRGLLDEVNSLLRENKFGPQSGEALGYKQLLAALRAGGSAAQIENAVEQIKIETRRFAKNQRTWLRRLSMTRGSVWIDAESLAPDAWPGRVLEALGVTPA